MHAFRCPKTGIPEMFDDPGVQPCGSCGGEHETYPTGVPDTSGGFPSVIGDRLLPHMDWAAGCEITSKSQRRRIYAAKGLSIKSADEHRRKHGGLEKRGKAGIYPGQTNFRSSAERGLDEVRTKTGQRVV